MRCENARMQESGLQYTKQRTNSMYSSELPTMPALYGFPEKLPNSDVLKQHNTLKHAYT
jgi:hypothetical protein